MQEARGYVVPWGIVGYLVVVVVAEKGQTSWVLDFGRQLVPGRRD